ncbi:AraC family transcriptional regulator [Collinsella sp. AGMB00827]|uniref:AraC family transcriptional regulator n=1 Tax=Collinsella ureilytica TaxID=2869515 RepID=A0ABS7MLW2_9ACTN|nr:AraC family transcriptional regulator [Collinsella urealyticum]MBY4798283.1 AraC family transcriptional regulator [Collinsella urealyticum]
MESLEENLYSAAFQKWGFSHSQQTHGYGPDGVLRTVENEFGTGEYWSYFRGNLFAINCFKIKFTKDRVLTYRCSEHLSITFYDKITGLTQRQGAPLSAGAISVYLGGEGQEYQAYACKGASIRGTSITFSPDYYRTYLQRRFGTLGDIRRAFLEIDGKRDMPDLINLLRKARNYKGTGAAAELFYEGVISEAVALVMQHSSLYPKNHIEMYVTGEDRKAIDFICEYIACHLEENLSCAHLARQLYIGKTKLKTLFKATTGMSPSGYIMRERMEKASRLLIETDCSIAEIGKKVGYAKPGAFTEAFRREKGLTPTQFRKRC